MCSAVVVPSSGWSQEGKAVLCCSTSFVAATILGNHQNLVYLEIVEIVYLWWLHKSCTFPEVSFIVSLFLFESWPQWKAFFLQYWEMWEIMKPLFETSWLEEKLLLITREKKDFSSTVGSSMLQFLMSLTKCSHKPLNSGNSNNPSKMVCYQQLVTSFLVNGLRGKALRKLYALFPLRQFNWLR